jgi:CubicO group peptidase (beta-lactamase class C family)
MNRIGEIYKSYFKNQFSDFCKDKSNGFHVAGLVIDGKLEEVIHFGNIPDGQVQDVSRIRFPIASMTKVFTACCILKLRDEGKLSLEDKLVTYLPELSSDCWKDITIKNLLIMNSGLLSDEPWCDRLLGSSDTEYDKILQSNFIFANKPGETFYYSNLGYVLLGKIIQNVSALPYTEYVKKSILEPLKMSDTDWSDSSKGIINGLKFENNTWNEILPLTVGGYAGAFGGLYSTIQDLTKFILFMQGAYSGELEGSESILSKDSRRELQSPQVDFPNINIFDNEFHVKSYAMGLISYESSAGRSKGHSGGLPGYGSHFRWREREKVGIIFLSNHTYNTGSKVSGNILNYAVNMRSREKLSILPIVRKRAEELLNSIREYGNSNDQFIFSSNFFLDYTSEDYAALMAELKHALIEEEPVLVSDRGLAASLVFKSSILYFSLTPAENGRIQELIFKPF